MRVLYQIFLYKKNKIDYTTNGVIEEYMDNIPLEEHKIINTDFLKELVEGVLNNINDIDNNKSLLSIQSYVKQKGTNEIYILDESLPKWIEASRSMHIEVANLLSMLKYE